MLGELERRAGVYFNIRMGNAGIELGYSSGLNLRKDCDTNSTTLRILKMYQINVKYYAKMDKEREDISCNIPKSKTIKA